MIQAVLFDYGGVVGCLDRQEVQRLEEKYGLPLGGLAEALYGIPEWEEVQVGRGSEDRWLKAVAARLYELAGRPIPGIRQEWPRMWRGIDHDVVSLARRLRPRYKVGLLSNATKNLEEQVLNHQGILHLFDVVINSAHVGIAKPDVRIYHLAAERLGVPASACVFVDDLLQNVEGARAAGMRAFQYQGIAHLEEELRALGVRW
ncbi:MAG: HAD family phosphatase [Chloroflexota bacterium]|nr:HAD family phosphatase [Chloroflexota bacterium]